MKRVARLWTRVLFAAPLCLFALMSTPASGATWSDLWLTPDQRAQRLLDSGHPKEAASLFSDPRRQAYAQLQAHQYATAAQELAPYQDTQSQYNRGNALARAGDLQGAIAAYDAALKAAPGDADAARNREIVANELRRRSQSQQPAGASDGSRQSGGSGQQSAGGKQQAQGSGQQRAQGSGQQAQGSGQQAQGSGQQAQGSAQQPQGSGQQSQGSSPQAAGSGTQAAGPGQVDHRSAGSGRQPADPGQQSGASGEADLATTQPPGASAQRSRTADPTSAAAGSQAAGHQARSSTPAESEQSLAMDQWLRRIPEDSGELLRRKFLIEHMLKQQDARP